MGNAISLRAVESLAVHLARRRDGAASATALVATAFADRGIGWIALSAAGAVPARTRAAARDGLCAWGAASAAAFAVKSATDRRRPSLAGRGRRPSSSSMPSSHTAGAVAYAVAASLQHPAALPTVPIAAAVAWSRTANGRHFPTDVLAGAALGVTVGAVVHRVVVSRRRRRSGPQPSPRTPGGRPARPLP